jgi:hypothetical protein
VKQGWIAIEEASAPFYGCNEGRGLQPRPFACREQETERPGLQPGPVDVALWTALRLRPATL